jgi:hypothetical protein
MIYYDRKGYEDLRDTVLWLRAKIAQLIKQGKIKWVKLNK